jgi:two-component system, cell cycle sensor histidine kinase and response regulator CckA
MNMAAYLNLAAAVFALAVMFFAWRGREWSLSRHIRWLIAWVGLLITFRSVSNVLQWSDITQIVDRYEDYIELFLPLLYFLILYAFAHEKTREEIEERDAYLSALFASIPLGIITVDTASRRIVFVNPAGAKLLGASQKKLVNEQSHTHTCTWEKGRCPVLDCDEAPEPFECAIVRTDGMELPVLKTATRVIVNGEPLLLECFQDISAHKKVEAERIQLEEQLRHSQKMEAIGQLAGGIAHDFNNLLQAIQGNNEMALDKMAKNDPLRDYLIQSQRGAERAASLTRQLLTFSRHDQFEPKAIHLNTLLIDLLKMLHRVIGEQIELTVARGRNLDPVLADAGQIEQVVMNLCINARDAMPDGGRLSIETANETLDAASCPEHSLARPGAYVRLSVSDTGSGIPDEIRERIFDPFFTTKPIGEGTGLGLATVYAIVHRHDGFVTLTSETGAGTTFHIHLPACAIEPRPETKPTQEAGASGGTETILLAEDDELVRTLAEDVLREAGYRLYVACDGEEASEILKAHGHELNMAILDVVMPKHGGRQVYDEMQSHNLTIPVLFTSGYSFGAHGEGEIPDGTHLLQKPYRRAALLQAIRDALNPAKG